TRCQEASGLGYNHYHLYLLETSMVPSLFQENRRCLMQRRALGVVLACLFLFGWILSACGSSTGSPGGGNSPITLTVATNQVGNQAQVLQDIAQKFMRANPNIKVDFSAPGAEYENIMKVKMASKHLTDVFSTHGWAKIRYGSFLADLRD